MKLYITLIVTLLIILVIVVSCVVSYTFIEKYKTPVIPKVIWTYWDCETLPQSVKSCVVSWKKYNPDHKIIILNKNNLYLYTNEDIFNFKFSTTSQRTSDFVRLCVLAKHGGTWADATIFMTKPLRMETQYEFMGYYINGFTTDKKYPVIENWFFRCLPKSYFITKWKDAFLKINDYNSVEDYVDYIKKNIDIQKIPMPEYLTMHLAAQWVLQKDDVDMLKLKLLSAEDGPFKYLVKNDWDSNKAVKDLAEFRFEPIIKLRGGERKEVDNENINLESVFS